jgi:hypothetical protein
MDAGDGGAPLIEERIERPQIAPYARRVTRDGEYLEYTDVRYVFENGETRFEPQPLEWRLLWRLRPEHLEELRDAIRRSGFFELKPLYEPSGTSIGGSNVSWTASLDGRTHTVELHGVPDVEVPELDALADRLGEVLQKAADAEREAREPG